MKTFWLFAALLLAAAPGAAQDPPKKQDVTLTCKPPALKDKQPNLVFSGTANFPDGTALKLTLAQAFESYTGTRIVPVVAMGGSGLIEVKEKKIQHTVPITGLGSYSVDLNFSDDDQRPAILASLKGKITTRTWNFSFHAWGDDLVGRLGPKLTELDVIAHDCIDVAARIEKLASTEGGWVKERKNEDARGADLVLTKEAVEALKDCAKIMTRLERSDLKLYFPAAFNELYFTLRTTSGNAQHFSYEQGKFAGAKSYHFPGQKMTNHRNEEFNFDNVKRYLEEAIPIAGREMALWIVKDLKRTEGQMRPDIQSALKTYAPHAGLSPFADRLAAATLADLKGFEEEIRVARNDTGDASKDKDKDKPAAAEWVCPVCKKKNKAADAACKATADCKGTKP